MLTDVRPVKRNTFTQRFNRLLSRSFSYGMRVFGLLLVAVALSLFGVMAYNFFLHVLPAYQMNAFEFPGLLFSLIGLTVLFNIVFNYVSAWLTHPGTPPSDSPQNIDQLLAAEHENQRGVPRGQEFSQFCSSCRIFKPPRTHHCSFCGKCVLKMDHHCPWIDNCVGFENQRYFYRFLLFLPLGCLFIVSMTVPLMFDCDPNLWRLHQSGIQFSLILCGSTLPAVLVLSIMHTNLIMSNQTTIEMHHNKIQRQLAVRRGEVWRNVYDLGRKKNFQQVFGVRRLPCWCLLPWAKGMGDGLSFETNWDGFIDQSDGDLEGGRMRFLNTVEGNQQSERQKEDVVDEGVRGEEGARLLNYYIEQSMGVK